MSTVISALKSCSGFIITLAIFKKNYIFATSKQDNNLNMQNTLFEDPNVSGSSAIVSIIDAVTMIKKDLEGAIHNGGCTNKGERVSNGNEAKNNLIRSQGPINHIHQAVKSSFIEHGVNPDLILPPLGNTAEELCVYGFVKKKNQDVCIVPGGSKPVEEVLTFDGILKGEVDPLGYEYTERVLAVNVRSQLSSISKNFDTLYERTFAEPLNLHLRCPKMVLGEVYMIPVYEYDDEKAKNNIVDFKPNRCVKSHIEKYISSFNAVNNRSSVVGQEIKYERACLLIVDFRYDIPRIYNTDEELIRDGLLSPDSGISINNLTFDGLVPRLLDIYSQRFGIGMFR